MGHPQIRSRTYLRNPIEHFSGLHVSTRGGQFPSCALCANGVEDGPSEKNKLLRVGLLSRSASFHPKTNSHRKNCRDNTLKIRRVLLMKRQRSRDDAGCGVDQVDQLSVDGVSIIKFKRSKVPHRCAYKHYRDSSLMGEITSVCSRC